MIEVNKSLSSFAGGKDKVKRLSLLSDLNKGGLKASHLESIKKPKDEGLCVVRNLPRNSKVIGRLSFPII